MTMFYTASEEKWVEEKRQEKIVQGIALVQCSDGVWRAGAERAAFEASRGRLQMPDTQ